MILNVNKIESVIFRKINTLKYLILKNLRYLTLDREMPDFFSDMKGESKYWFGVKALHNAKKIVTAKNKDKLIGIAGIDKHNELFIIVKCKYWNKGIGTKLMTKLLTNLTKPIGLTVDAKNINAIRLYQKFGFKETEKTIKMKWMPIRKTRDKKEEGKK